MKKFYILLIVTLGFLMMPTLTFACGTHSEKNSCGREISSRKESCCENDNHTKNKNHNGCGGKCGHSLCGNPSVNFGLFTIVELELKGSLIDFSYIKQTFYSSETVISSGFYSLWLIPKIS